MARNGCAAVDEAVSLADESGDRRAADRPFATAGSYGYLASGEYEGCERLLDEALELAGDDHMAGAGVVIGCPYAFALHFKGVLARERVEFDRG